MIIFRTTTFLNYLLTLLILNICSIGSVDAAQLSREEYIHRYKDIAIAHQQRYNIPASITMAQGLLESGNGNSTLARKSNNHFGIKCGSKWSGKSVKHDDDARKECFRAYKKVEDSYADHADFLKSSARYASLFKLEPTDYKGWARGLKAAGYATAPTYAEMLIKIIEDNRLYELDTSGSKRLAKKAAKVKANGIDPNNFRVSVNSQFGYNIYQINNTHYTKAKSGDTYTSLAKTFGLSRSAIRKYNDEPNRKATLSAGEIVYLERKQRKWLAGKNTHPLASGETIRQISQIYAIQEAMLRRYNKLDKESNGIVGTNLKLR